MTSRRAATRIAAEQGSAAIPFALALPVMLGLMGFALDLSNMYSRKSELQQFADSTALTAARELNGTRAGVTLANARARNVAIDNYFSFGRRMDWNPAALSFAASADAPEGEWRGVSEIGNDDVARGLRFAKVDTSRITDVDGRDPGAIRTLFIRVLPGAPAQVDMSARAVAGPASVQVTPLAICALDADSPTGTHTNAYLTTSTERTEYGFRRGVSYNLLDLSPNSTAPGGYLVNPVDPGSRTNNTAHFAPAFVQPFFCTGSVALADLKAGSSVHIQSLGSVEIHDWLNSRFNDYPAGTGCNVATAPPDTNIREFDGGWSNWYMGIPTNPYPPSAMSIDKNGTGARVTFADLETGDTTSATATAEAFGPLWTFAKPVSTAGATYTLTNWPDLYRYGSVWVPAGNSTRYGSAASAYLSSNHREAPPASTRPAAQRRVLNVPLLNCSAGTPATPAPVLAIGRFFMTARATSSPQRRVPGEFAGVLALGVPPSRSVALYK